MAELETNLSFEICFPRFIRTRGTGIIISGNIYANGCETDVFSLSPLSTRASKQPRLLLNWFSDVYRVEIVVVSDFPLSIARDIFRALST